ncbi:contractile injection system tape measure protein [Chryseobacterium lactis]|uniref:contractile injection system tape measure protein n=1 Tax=Chryseobacterium lactis TaxID=1241981 RepID=UPI001628D74F|nr:contractile injection system tape measure protein [Chryseobacterium lactis]
MNQDHNIQKVSVEITVDNKERGLSIKEDINSFLSIDVFPEIEKYINTLEYNSVDYTLQIPRLELNLDVKNGSLNTELKDKIIQIFKKEFSAISQSIVNVNQKTENESKAYLIGHQEKTLKAFLHFLEKGNMPWWNPERKGISFLEPTVFDTLIAAENFEKSIVPLLSKQNVQDRMINQLSNEQIAQLCLVILKNKELKLNLEAGTIRYLSKLSHPDRHIIWRLILNIVSEYLRSSNSNTLKEYLIQQITKIEAAGLLQTKNSRQDWKEIVKIFPFIKENEVSESIKINAKDSSENTKTLKERMESKNENADKSVKEVMVNLGENKDEKEGEKVNLHEPLQKDSDQNDGHYVQNAGLILIHPFIKTFLEHCDLLHPKTKQLTDPELAAHLLHYIATGNTNAPEYDMVFEKFLCNIPMNQSINRHIKLSRKHKTQAKNVIESVQHNWAPMKKSSAALLQNEFFQRTGKLVITDYDHTLTIERKAQDILLNKLAWGIGLFKLPWQEKFIFVNW